MVLKRTLAAALALFACAAASAPDAHCGGPVADEAAAQACEARLRSALAAARHADDAQGDGAVAADTTLYAAVHAHGGFRFEPGDLILLRGVELVSSAISQIGRYPAFFSHVAIVGLDAQWNALEIVEAGVEEGLRVAPIEDWLERGFVRAAVYRHRDAHIARAAAIAAHADAVARRGEALRYDFALDLDDPARLYCSEVVTRAFAAADPQAARVPWRIADVGALAQRFPLSALGVNSHAVFLPDDIELDARFERVLELHVPERVARSAAMDRVLRELLDGLRGSQREAIEAEIAAERPSRIAALPALLRGSHAAWRALPADARADLAGLVRVVERRLEVESAVTVSAGGR